jgi:hypothetical protein
LIISLFITININLKAQEVYHFPKAENWSLSGHCYDELHAIEKKAETRSVQYEADVEDYKKGRFCSDCKRSAGQIEREMHITFEQHIANGAANGRTSMTATSQMYADLYKAYQSDWKPLKSAYDQKAIDCQGIFPRWA